MAVYNIKGISIDNCFKTNGDNCINAYDIDNNVIFPDGERTLTVMSFNVGTFYTEWHPAPPELGSIFYERNRTILRECAANIAGMPEWYDMIGEIPASELMDEFYPYYYPEFGAYGKSGSALTSAFTMPATNVELIPFNTQNPNAAQRFFQRSYIKYNNKRICFIVTHLDLKADIRAVQFIELLDIVANEDYFIITGDLNFAIREIGDDEYNRGIQPALDRGYHSAQNAQSFLITYYSGTTVEGSTYGVSENVITSPNINMLNPRINTEKLTDGLCEEYGVHIDHLPFLVDLQFDEEVN